ncbi:sulfate transport system permease protein CysW [bacterium BMS3Bbin10]|nr:sulfate transport system permease protein CysW [bacterium BMS3Bbin10]HDL17142.1 ABC transporter permease subunit [Hyphomicrobiales bacterium]
MRRPWLFYSQFAFTIGVCTFLIVPVIMSMMAGITENFFLGIKSGVTLRWVYEVLDLYLDTIYLSLLIAVICLIVTLILGIPTAYVLAKKSGRWARMFEEFLVLPVAIPGLAIALALIVTYGGFRDFRTSWGFILVGHVLYTLPFMVRSVLAVLSSTDFQTLEESAASLGASFWQRFFGIIIPNCRSGILAGSLMVVTLSVGEFNLTWMLHTPLTKTLPVGLADSYASMRLEIGSAYTLVFLIMILPLLIGLQMFGTSKERKPAVPDEDPSEQANQQEIAR